jgi:hypothetical protein
MNYSKEIWRDVKNTKSQYRVSNKGRIRSFKHREPKILAQRTNRKGYKDVTICMLGIKKSRTIHQLVAESFLDHKADGHNIVVNHKDFNKTNNNIDNLELVTARENSNLKHIKSTSKYVGVAWRKDSKKWRAYINIKKKKIHLGSFVCEFKAHIAYETKLKEIISERAKISI